MRILLVYPVAEETFWSFTHVLKIIHRKAIYPPLGALTIAALLPSSWEKRLVDMNVKKTERQGYSVGGLRIYKCDDGPEKFHKGRY